MNSIKDFWNSYKGAILGVILAVLIILTNLYKLIVAIILLFLGAFVGNYIQQNKNLISKLTRAIQICLKNYDKRPNSLRYCYKKVLYNIDLKRILSEEEKDNYIFICSIINYYHHLFLIH